MLELYIVRDRRNGGTVVTVIGPGNLNLEIFLRSFDIMSGNQGRWYIDPDCPKKVFNCSNDFFELAKTDDFVGAFQRLGVDVVHYKTII